MLGLKMYAIESRNRTTIARKDACSIRLSIGQAMYSTECDLLGV